MQTGRTIGLLIRRKRKGAGFWILTVTFLLGMLGCKSIERPLAEVVIESGAHNIEPPGSEMAGYESIDYKVRLTNLSKTPIWYEGDFAPYHLAETRTSADQQWKIEPRFWCGVGMQTYRLEPGASCNFPVWISPDQVGSEIRVTVEVRTAPEHGAKSIQVRSAGIKIR